MRAIFSPSIPTSARSVFSAVTTVPPRITRSKDMEQVQPKLLFPQLQSFYRCVEPLSWALIRITAGLMLIPHGWPKLMMGISATANMALVKRGIAPAEPLAIVLITLETLGGLCIALGLATPAR